MGLGGNPIIALTSEQYTAYVTRLLGDETGTAQGSRPQIPPRLFNIYVERVIEQRVC